MPDNIARVSVVIPCYRCTTTITCAVASIATQTLKPAEVILVEDSSGDATLDTLYQLQASYPENWIKVIALPENVGPGTARNVGWEAAMQPYIAFLDSDDSWYPQKIEIQYDWMVRHPEVALTGHKCKVAENGYAIVNSSKVVTGEPRLITGVQLLLSNRFQTPSVLLRRDLLLRFQEGKRYSEDFLLWLEICLNGQPCYRFDGELAFLHKSEFGAGGLSGQLWKLERGELNTYYEIYKQKLINFWTFVCLACYSLMKFARRVVVAKILRKFF